MEIFILPSFQFFISKVSQQPTSTRTTLPNFWVFNVRPGCSPLGSILRPNFNPSLPRPRLHPNSSRWFNPRLLHYHPKPRHQNHHPYLVPRPTHPRPCPSRLYLRRENRPCQDSTANFFHTFFWSRYSVLGAGTSESCC